MTLRASPTPRRTEEPLMRLDDLKVADKREAELPGLVAAAVLVAGRLEIDGREFHQRAAAAFTASSANAVLSRGCTSFISPSPAANVSTKIAPVSSQTSR